MMRLGVFVVLMGMVLSGCSIISPGERGVRISLGKVSQEPMSPGAYLWFPFLYGVAKFDVQIQKGEVKSTAASKDMQDVYANVAINWAIDPSKVVKTYQDIGNINDLEARILTPAVNEVMKSACAKRTAEEVLTHRMDLKKDIDDGLMNRLSNYGIILKDVSIVDLKFSEGFAHAIEEKQIAEQQAKRASYIAEQATEEAKAEVERAKGQAESQRLLRTNLTAEILQQQAIEKWNGKLPDVILGNGCNTILDLSKLRAK